MSTLNPPIALEKPENQVRVDYIQDYASGKIIDSIELAIDFPSTPNIQINCFLFSWFILNRARLQLSTRVL